MKKGLLMLFFFLGAYATQAQELQWYNDVSKASEVSMKTKKPMMLFFTGSDWCGWCMRLQKEVFNTPEFTKWAKENVVLVELDFPRKKQLSPEIVKQNANLEEMFGIRGYPTVWLVNPSNNGGQVAFERLGSTGYVAGGPSSWLAGANGILGKK